MTGVRCLRVLLVSSYSGALAGFAALPSNSAYAATYGTEVAVDQAAFSSSAFWAEVEAAVPGFRTDPSLDRFRGWVENLRTRPPGETVELETGQEILTQYQFPGLQSADVERTPFPELPQLQEPLKRLVPTATAELQRLLLAQPLGDDDAPSAVHEEEENDDESQLWNRAAWYGWQFLTLRDAKPWMPQTITAVARELPAAHRFIGVARQRRRTSGTLHSDRRNYLLSTLTGLRVPKGKCGVVVPGSGERLLAEGEVLLLDNTFKHFVYNDADEDRFVLMVECWHPELTEVERRAMATTFAVKDRFTLVQLRQCPWGFGDEELTRAIKSKAFKELDFWRDIACGLG